MPRWRDFFPWFQKKPRRNVSASAAPKATHAEPIQEDSSPHDAKPKSSGLPAKPNRVNPDKVREKISWLLAPERHNSPSTAAESLKAIKRQLVRYTVDSLETNYTREEKASARELIEEIDRHLKILEGK